MVRQLSSETSLENLKREAKRWLHALQENDAAARKRLERMLPDAPATPTLRNVQHALAREHDFPSWASLKEMLQQLQIDANFGAESEDGTTMLTLVVTPLRGLLALADRGSEDDVRAWLENGAGDVNERGELEGHSGLRTALHFAVGASSEAKVALLLQHGADPNIRDEGDNATPLHFAAEKEALPIIKLLVEHGANAAAGDTMHELDVLGWATVFGTGRKDVVDYLLANGARHTLASAVATGATREIEALLNDNPSLVGHRLDNTNKQRTMLHLAVVKKQLASVQTLVKFGVDVNATDATGLTPLDHAALAHQLDIVSVLLERGAHVTLPAAVALNSAADVERIMAADPQLLQPGNLYGTLIVQVAEIAGGDVVDALVRHGASVNVVARRDGAVDETQGYTPLHAAAFAGNESAVDVLLRAGASVRAREQKYCATPAGWARYAGYPAIADRILAGDIDIFDAVDFHLVDRVAPIVASDPGALHRPFGQYVNGGRDRHDSAKHPDATPLDVARERDNAAMIATLQELDTRAGVLQREERVNRFLLNACRDWRWGGGAGIRMAQSTAMRLLQQYPEIADADLLTAIVCGNVERVKVLLRENPALANVAQGPKEWPPLLYLAYARLPLPATNDNAPAIAELLIEHGADPSAYFADKWGNRFTVLTGVLGRGESISPTHPNARALATALVMRGAEPYDVQLFYEVFADHSSRALLGDDMIWLLQLIHERSVQLGRGADWSDPDWKMLDIFGGSRCGANYLLCAAAGAGLVRMTEWMLAHGANPNARATNPHFANITPHAEALRGGHTAVAELLVRHGATPVTRTPSGYEAFVETCMRLDRATAKQLAAEHPHYLSQPRALANAASANRADVIELLLDLGVSPLITNPREGNNTPLHDAAFAGATDAALVLMKRGADVDARETKYGATPLGMAIWAQHPHTAALIAEHSKDIFGIALAGSAKRVRAVLHENPELARAIHEDGRSVLMCLPDNEDSALEIAKLLIQHGADAYHCDANGMNAIHLAEQRAMGRVVSLLSTRT